MCFIDYSKAFDCIDHNRMWNNLRDMEVPEPVHETRSNSQNGIWEHGMG
jgi:hypothetical protein